MCLGCSSTGSGRIRISAATCGREGSCGSIGLGYMRAWLFLGIPPKWWFSLTPKDKPMTLVSYRCCLLGSPLFCWAEKLKENWVSPIFDTPNKNVHPKRVACFFLPPVGPTCPCDSAWAAPARAAVEFGSAPPPADAKEVADRLASTTCGLGFFRESTKWWFSLTPKDKPVTLVSYRCCLLGGLPLGELRQALLTRPHRGANDLQAQLS